MEQFPRGKLTDDDEGALTIRMTTQDKTIVVEFGKPVAWIGLDRATALDLAINLLKRVAGLT